MVDPQLSSLRKARAPGWPTLDGAACIGAATCRCTKGIVHSRAVPKSHATADVHAPPAHACVLVVPDPDADASFETLVLGHALSYWQRQLAERAGTALVWAAEARLAPPGSDVVLPGMAILGPTVVLAQGTLVDPRGLAAMLAAPVHEDGAWTMDDGKGRPAWSFVRALGTVPSVLPVYERRELPGPPIESIRWLRARDRHAVETFILERWAGLRAGGFARAVERPLLSLCRHAGVTSSQLELVTVACTLAIGPLACVAGDGGRMVAAALLLAVHLLTSVGHVNARLMQHEPRRSLRALPALGQAALACGLGLSLVWAEARPVQATVWLALAGAGALAPLLHARSLLRDDARAVWAAPTWMALAERFDVPVPARWRGVPVFELAVLLTAWMPASEVCFAVVLTVSLTRWLTWFAASTVRGAPSPPRSGY